MEQAKAAVSKFTSNKGHRTEVDEVVNQGVTSETVKPHQHENVTQAVDREVHQHHYHTTVQPISHKETLPEKHTHNVIPTEHREFRHDNESDTKERVARELGQFKDTSTTHETRHTQEAAPTVTGEHVHHHVHETVQPVIHKETIQPHVVHTTVPVHETHHVDSEHHGISALPMKTLDEFKQTGGVLTGGKGHSREEYEGQPRPYNDKLSTTFEKLGMAGHGSHGTHNKTDSGIGGVGHNTSSSGHGTSTNAGPHDSNLANKSDARVDSDRDGSGMGNTGTHNSSMGGTTEKKPSLLDRLNPMKDTDGDGKKGMMD